MTQQTRGDASLTRSAQAGALAIAGILAVSASCAAQDAINSASDTKFWQIHIEPVMKTYAHIDDVYIVLSVKNISNGTRKVTLPYLDTQEWFQWVEVFRDGQKLPSKPDEDFPYPPSTLKPDQTVSLLVSLTKFFDSPDIGRGPGRYTLRWNGGTIGFADSATASFSVDASTARFPNVLSLSYYVSQPSGTPSADEVRRLWNQVVNAPNDAHWLGLLRIVPVEYVDASALFKLLESSNDLGIEREAVRALGRIGRHPELVTPLLKWLSRNEDTPLQELAVQTQGALQGDSSK